MKVSRFWVFAAAWIFCILLQTQAQVNPSTNVLGLLPVGANYLRVISPDASGNDVLELVRIVGDSNTWNFSADRPAETVFQVYTNNVAISGTAVTATGFKRRGYYGPLPQERIDRRIECSLYLKLSVPVPDGATVKVTTTNGTIPAGMQFETIKSPLRYSPAIHVNEQGYLPGQHKLAMIGYYFGDLNLAPGTFGEMDISGLLGHPERFKLLDAITGLPASYAPAIKQRSDAGGDPNSASDQYQNVIEVDFSGFTQSGEYVLQVDGLGVSFPFRIDDRVAMTVARAYALGLYHKRCGEGTAGHQVNDLPFTRFLHGDCHTSKASIPIPEATFSVAWDIIAGYGSAPPSFVDQHAPNLNNATNQLFNFGVNQPQVQLQNGEYKIDVSGGHHDAGDYSKYTINSAKLIHTLVFAADNFKGSNADVGNLDNFGIPESGNGAGDLLDEAKREADFLLKMQDNGTRDVAGTPIVPGGFYALVYPRDRQYENDVLPDHGAPQIVWPKTTADTAAAVAALAEIGSSPKFAVAFQNSFNPPLDRTDWVNNPYLAAARRGWDFLMSALDAEYAWAAPGTSGKDNSFQRLYHYGDWFSHNDELAWAAAAMFAAGYATGSGHSDTNPQHDPHTLLKRWYPEPASDTQVPYSYPCGPGDEMGPCTTRVFGWWEMAEGYGCATRDYAFAQRSGRLAGGLDPIYRAKSETAISAWANKVRQWSDDNAYGVSLAPDYKNNWNPGFYFPSQWSYDIAVADSLWRPGDSEYDANEHAHNLSALVENSNYECGRNPNNVSFVTGLGWKRQRAIVDQYSWNDPRTLPPTGILVGAIQFRFKSADPYGFDDIYFPAISHSDFGDIPGSFALYDRWVDAFSLNTESVVHQMARGLCVAAYLATQTPGSSQTWSASNIISANVTIDLPNGPPSVGSPATVTLNSTIDLSDSQIVWESFGSEPRFGQTTTVERSTIGELWIEAEACLPDGRRVFGARTLYVNDPLNGERPHSLDSNTVALYHFDGNFNDSSSNGYHCAVSGGTVTFTDNTTWMANPTGKVAHFSGLGDRLTATFPRNALLDMNGQSPRAGPLTIELRIYPRHYPYIDSGFAEPFKLFQEDDAQWAFQYQHNGNEVYDAPVITACGATLLDRAGWQRYLTKDTWHKIKITVQPAPNSNQALMAVYIDDVQRVGPVSVAYNPRLIPYQQDQYDWTLTLGEFDGDIDEVRISNTARVNPPPLADFVAGVTNGLAPLAVTFTNLSLNATNFLWDFGDGNTSSSASPVNVYTNAGSFTVSLTAIGIGGTNAFTLTNYVVVTNFPPPLADFIAGVTNGTAPLAVTFTNLSLYATNFLWDFGDGNTSTNASPINVYSNAGGFTVSLTAIGIGGTNALTLTNCIIVTNAAPILIVPADQTIVENTTLVVTNFATDISRPTNELTFSLVSGRAGIALNSSTGVLTWTPTEDQGPSTNLVIIKVSDDQPVALSVTNSFTIVVTEANSPPVLTPPATQTVVELTTMVVTNLAADPDIPTNSLTFTLVSAPQGVTLNSLTGVLTWTPTEAQSPSTNQIIVSVRDDGIPNLSATNGFLVIVNRPSQIVGRYVFYNNSKFDGNDPAANTNDDHSIAPDKLALLPGQIASYTNVTSYSRGINGVMIDISGLPGIPTASDFEFKTGNDNPPSSWSAAPSPTSVTVRDAAGTNGSTRVTLVWENNAIQKTWLQVRLRSTVATGLAADDVFYFGNAIGESGNSAIDLKVDLLDQQLPRINPHTALNPATIDLSYDYNRDQKVDLLDQAIARVNGTTVLNALRLIDLSSAGSSASSIAKMNLRTASNSVADIPGRLRIWNVGERELHLELTGAVGAAPQLETTDNSALNQWSGVNVAPAVSTDGTTYRWTLPFPPSPAQYYRTVVKQ